MCVCVDGYPATVNAYPECAALVRQCAGVVVGNENTLGKQRTMGAEDFSFFLEARPGAFFFVGAGLPGEARPHHKSVFDFDEVSTGMYICMYMLYAGL